MEPSPVDTGLGGEGLDADMVVCRVFPGLVDISHVWQLHKAKTSLVILLNK